MAGEIYDLFLCGWTTKKQHGLLPRCLSKVPITGQYLGIWHLSQSSWESKKPRPTNATPFKKGFNNALLMVDDGWWSFHKALLGGWHSPYILTKSKGFGAFIADITHAKPGVTSAVLSSVDPLAKPDTLCQKWSTSDGRSFFWFWQTHSEFARWLMKTHVWSLWAKRRNHETKPTQPGRLGNLFSTFLTCWKTSPQNSRSTLQINNQDQNQFLGFQHLKTYVSWDSTSRNLLKFKPWPSPYRKSFKKVLCQASIPLDMQCMKGCPLSWQLLIPRWCIHIVHVYMYIVHIAKI